MLSHRSALAILALVSLVTLGLNGWYWTQLPDRVATHFNLLGKPDAWMNKHAATLIMCSFQLGLPLIMLCVAELVAVLPVRCINIPHREYWLSPERRGETIEFIRLFMARVAVLMSLFFLALNHLIFMANRQGGMLNSFLFAIVLLVFLIFISLQTQSLLVRFRLPREQN